VPFQIPAGNKNQLNMTGAGNIITVPWNNNSALILSNMMSIQAAFTQISNWPMTHVWINGTMWPNIVTNTQIRNVGGTAQTPFAEFTNAPEMGMDGVPTGQYHAVLRALPMVQWHMANEVLALGGDIDISYASANSSAQKLIPDNLAIFTTDPNPNIAKLYLGGEPVVENPGMPAVIREGYYFWHEYTTQPSQIELIALLNAVPCLYTPSAFAPAQVIFP
jgi:hypothetical protein